MQNLILLYGGKSSEHSVSCVTALGVFSAVDKSKYRVIPVGIAKSGKFTENPINPNWVLSDFPEVSESSPEIRFEPGQSSITLASGETISIDIAFPVLHGPNGEDGSVQGLLQLMSVPYVGNGVLASALAMDKSKAKAVFRDAGLSVAPELLIERTTWALNRSGELARALSFATSDVFVKPSRSGSSVGVSLVRDPAELEKAIDQALKLDQTALVEQRIFGREVECSVLERPNGELLVSVAGEIVVTGREFYDYEAKYLDAGAELRVPTVLTESELSTMQQLAKMAFRALGCSGLARTDFFLNQSGFVLTEVNTMPGFTPISMYPALFAASGVGYTELVETLIQTGLAKGTDPR